MRKILALSLLTASSLAAVSCSTLCFAEEAANTPVVASPAAAPAQSSQQGMHHTQQVDGAEQNENKSEEAPVKADESAAVQAEEQPQQAVAVTNQVPMENAPSSSQRGMRQQIRDSQRNVTPITTGQ